MRHFVLSCLLVVTFLAVPLSCQDKSQTAITQEQQSSDGHSQDGDWLGFIFLILPFVIWQIVKEYEEAHRKRWEKEQREEAKQRYKEVQALSDEHRSSGSDRLPWSDSEELADDHSGYLTSTYRN